MLRNDRDIINGGRDRRIGSGRILARDVAWDYRPEKGDPESSETSSSFTNYRGSGGPNSGSNAPPSTNYREREEKPSYESRRSSNNYESSRGGNNRDYDSRDKDSNSYQSSRQYGDRNSRYSNNTRSSYNDRRRYSEKDEEPEWFSAGPTSQLETIDLHGFDGPISEEKDGRKEKSAEKGGGGGGTKGGKNENHEKSSRDNDRMKAERNEVEGRAESNNNPKINDTNNNKDQDGNKFPSGSDSQKQLLGEVLGNDGDDFNFEEFLNFDSITGLLTSVSLRFFLTKVKTFFFLECFEQNNFLSSKAINFKWIFFIELCSWKVRNLM